MVLSSRLVRSGSAVEASSERQRKMVCPIGRQDDAECVGNSAGSVAANLEGSDS